MKTIIFVIVLLQSVFSLSQIQFELIPPLPSNPQNDVEFWNTYESSIAFADIDGDNDEDILITGRGGPNVRMSILYRNDGLGNYEEISGLPFDGVMRGAVAFADIDNDNDQDVLITGNTNSVLGISKLYTNDGSGNFTEVVGTQFIGVHYSSVAFEDVDNDNDQDVLITGRINGGSISKLYTNDGTGSYTEVPGTPFEGVQGGSVAFSDVDGDNDSDLVISGYSENNVRITKLYTNDGSGNFTHVAGTPFTPLSNCSIGFLDIDGDNDADLLITGQNSSGQEISELYTNDGSGNYNAVSGTIFEGVFMSSIAIADIDNDNDKDLLITGENSATEPVSKLYMNDGSGVFSEVLGTSIAGVKEGSVAFEDVDGDNHQDLVITGKNSVGISKLYMNDGLGNFIEATGNTVNGISFGSVAFADIDSDNDQDLFITGRNSLYNEVSKLYDNNGSAIYNEIVGAPFVPLKNSSVAFADVDNDNDEDVLLTGRDSANDIIIKLYENDGTGNYTEVTDLPFVGVSNGAIAFADIDGDNDKDVLVAGYGSNFSANCKLYTNDGTGNFTEFLGTPFTALRSCSVAFADVDNDNDLDLLITGENSFNNPVSELYINDGAGNYSELTGAPFDDVEFGSLAFADADGDNDQDVLISGLNSSYQEVSKLYLNDGIGNYSELTSVPFIGVMNSSVAFSDVDNDNDQDVLITGKDSNDEAVSKLYRNDGFANYTEVTGLPFDQVINSSVAFADVDGDNDQDVLIAGNNSSYRTVSKIYRNITCFSTSGTDIQTACDSYTWIDGNTYTASNNTATHTLTNAAGCDSIVTLDLTITNSTTGTDVQTACDSYNWIDGNTYTSSNNTATYTLTNAAGCDSIVTLDLTITNSTTGTDVQTACDSYTWIDGNTYTTSNNTATHTLTNAAGCDSIVTLDLTINTVDAGISQIDDETLTANLNGASYQWLDCDNNYAPIAGETGQSFVALTNGSYAVEVTGVNCTDTSNCVQFNSVGLIEYSSGDVIELFPNPTSEKVTIKLGDMNLDKLILTNAIGQKLETIIVKKNEIEINLSDFPSGIYYIRLKGESGEYNRRIVKR